MVLLLGAAAVK